MKNLKESAALALKALEGCVGSDEYTEELRLQAIIAVRDALEPEVNYMPRKLSNVDQKILNYCRQPRTSRQIREHISMTESGTYKHLRLLQRLDLLEKIEPTKVTGFNLCSTFVATGKTLDQGFVPEFMKTRPMVMGVRL